MEQKETNKRKSANGSRRVVPVILVVAVIAAISAYLRWGPKNSEILPQNDESEYSEVPENFTDPGHPDYDKIENGVHLRTGFAAGDNLMLVVNNCTTCHSAKLVTQNKMSKEQWKATIRWMQETQNLWELGANEEPIVNYLAKYYAPVQKGRRQNLANIEWYNLREN